MIIYRKDEEWWKAIWYFHTGKTARSLLKAVAIVTLYVTIIAITELRFYDLKLKYTPTEFLQAMGILLSLLLIFRTNTAYDRFYEGRRSWGELVNASRNLAALLNAILPAENRNDRLFFAKTISNFPFALKNHLRGERNMEEIDEAEEGEKRDLRHFEHLPGGVVNQLRVRLETLYREGLITDANSININQLVNTLLDVSGICERIKNTPIPFSYSFFVKLFIMIYIIFLPFTIIEEFGYLTIPAVAVTSYVLIGLEMIGEEIEDPFGLERNNLPLQQLSQLIRVNVHELLQIQLPTEEKQAAKTDNFVVIM